MFLILPFMLSFVISFASLVLLCECYILTKRYKRYCRYSSRSRSLWSTNVCAMNDAIRYTFSLRPRSYNFCKYTAISSAYRMDRVAVKPSSKLRNNWRNLYNCSPCYRYCWCIVTLSYIAVSQASLSAFKLYYTEVNALLSNSKKLIFFLHLRNVRVSYTSCTDAR